MSSVKRRSPRKRATDVIMVNNAMTGESMGRIGNLSNDGMMLIAPKELGDEYYYQVSFHLLIPGKPPQKMELGVQCLWADKSRSGGNYWAGCKLVDIAEADEAVLETWLENATEIEP
jgi:hypothetical protein